MSPSRSIYPWNSRQGIRCLYLFLTNLNFRVLCFLSLSDDVLCNFSICATIIFQQLKNVMISKMNRRCCKKQSKHFRIIIAFEVIWTTIVMKHDGWCEANDSFVKIVVWKKLTNLSSFFLTLHSLGFTLWDSYCAKFEDNEHSSH